MVNIWMFDSTGEAYDACNYDDKIKTGDVLVIASEQVVGLADAWPFAVTERFGKLHTVDPAHGIEAYMADRNKERPDMGKDASFPNGCLELARSIKFHDSCSEPRKWDDDYGANEPHEGEESRECGDPAEKARETALEARYNRLYRD